MMIESLQMNQNQTIDKMQKKLSEIHNMADKGGSSDDIVEKINSNLA